MFTLESSTSPSGENFARGYARVAIALHWTTAAFVLFNLVSGLVMEDLVMPYRRVILTAHVSSGFSVLALTLVRIIWRLTHRTPPLPPSLSWAERTSARGVHFVFYVLMVVMPVTGWMVVSANAPSRLAAVDTRDPLFEMREPSEPSARKRPDMGRGKYMYVWGLMPVPWIEPLESMGGSPEGRIRQKLLHDRFVDMHTYAAILFFLLLVLHVGGALKHQFVDRIPSLDRMAVRRMLLRSSQWGEPRDDD